MSTCTACTHDHARLGVRIENRTLYRSAVSSHRVRAYGGAWAFVARFWDTHRHEFDFVQIAERDTGHVYRASAGLFDMCAFREILNPLFGLQVILGLGHFNKPGAPLSTDTAAPGDVFDETETDADSAAKVQPILVQSTFLTGVQYEPARGPRPRRAPNARRRLK